MQNFYGVPAPKLNGKAMLARGHEAGNFALYRGSNEAAHLLEEVKPDIFWQSPHYQATYWILVREDRARADILEGLIERAWALRASPVQRAAHPDLGA